MKNPVRQHSACWQELEQCVGGVALSWRVGRRALEHSRRAVGAEAFWPRAAALAHAPPFA
eukprot:6424085-Alexandrium_andersonii.AAC.1